MSASRDNHEDKMLLRLIAIEEAKIRAAADAPRLAADKIEAVKNRLFAEKDAILAEFDRESALQLQKKSGRGKVWAAVGVAAMLVFGAGVVTLWRGGQGVEAQIVTMQGSAKHGNEALTVGMKLQPGETIATNAKSSAVTHWGGVVWTLQGQNAKMVVGKVGKIAGRPAIELENQAGLFFVVAEKGKADFSLPAERIKRAIIAAAGDDKVHMIDATAIATGVLGNAIAANMFLLGLAYQNGAVPLSGQAIEKAIELNGEAVKMNLEAFRWGRRAAIDQQAVEDLVAPLKAPTKARHLSQSLDETIARRIDFLTAYQNAAYAERYRSFVERASAAEKAIGKSGLADAVARYLFKLMAIKDEYEVARLYTDGAFQKQLSATFEGDMRLEFHLAPPLLARPDPTTGLPRKMSFGPWMLPAFKLLARMKGLRGGWLDIFGKTAERKMERQLIADYEKLLLEILAKLTPDNHALAVALASIPEKIRGFGHVKERHLKSAKAEEAMLLEEFRAGPRPAKQAAE